MTERHIELPAPTLAACLEALRYLCSAGGFQYVSTDELTKFFREHCSSWKPFTDAAAFSFILMLLKSLLAQNLVIYKNDQGWRPLEFEAAPPETLPQIESVKIKSCSLAAKKEEEQQIIVEAKKTSRSSKKRKEVPSKRTTVISRKDNNSVATTRSKAPRRKKAIRLTMPQKDDSKSRAVSKKIAVAKVAKTITKKSERKKKIAADLIDISLPTLATCLEAVRYLCLKQSKPVSTVNVCEFFMKHCKIWKPRTESTGEAFIDKLLRSLISHGLVMLYRNGGWCPEEFRDFKPNFLKEFEISDMTSANVQEAPRQSTTSTSGKAKF